MFLLGLALGGLFVWSVWSGSRARDQSRFNHAVLRTDSAIETRLALYIGMLRAGAGLYAGNPRLGPDEFRAFAERIDLPQAYPGAQGIGFARRVTHDDLEAFHAEQFREGREDFEIRPGGPRDEYFPIVHLEPPDRRNALAIGFDMFSEPVRREAMIRARDEGQAAATARLHLVQKIDPPKQAGFLIYVPVYEGERLPATVEERRARIRGFVYSPFRAGDLLEETLEGGTMPRVHFEIHDGPNRRAGTLLYRSPNPAAGHPSFTRTTRLTIADRIWSVRYVTTPTFERNSHRELGVWIALATLVVSLALAGITHALARAVVNAEERGRELASQREQLRVTLASIGDAVVATDAAGRVTFLNPVAERLTRRSLAQARGEPLEKVVPLVDESTGLPMPSPVTRVLSDGVTVELSNRTVLLTGDGDRIPIEDSAAPIRAADGSLIGVVLVFHDVTENRRSDERLAASEERRRLAAEAAGLGTWDHDLLAGLRHWDARCRALLGVPDDTPASAENFRSLLHPEDHERVLAELRNTLDPAGSGRCDIEYRVIRPKDRETRWIRAIGRTFFDHAPAADAAPGPRRARRFLGTVQDITERRRREHALRFLVELGLATQSLVEPDGIMNMTARMLAEHLDVERCAYAEIEREEIFVITGDHSRGVPSIVGRWPVVADTDADSRIGPAELPAYRATNIRAVICVPLHKTGRFTAAMAVQQTRPRRWAPDEIELVEMVVARCWESIERGRAIRGLRESEGRFRFLAEALPQKIATAGPDGAVDYMNRQWLEFTGASLDRLREWGWGDFLHPEDRERNLRHWAHCVERGVPFEAEQRFRRHDGAYRWHLTRAWPMRDHEGQVSMWIGSNTDISELVEARETLAGRHEELERLVRERTASLREAVEQMEEFSYSISHDLRAPLRAMQGYAQALLEDYAERLDAEGRRYLERIVAASSRMDRLTQDVLTYSRVAREPAHPRRIAIERLVGDSVQHHLESRPTAWARIDVEHPLHDVVGHEAPLMQAVSNRLDNALKFTAPGRAPRVRVRSEELGRRVRLWVEDESVGVPPDQQNRIWGMFERVHPHDGHAGTGIGLAIVRKTVERMGSRVGVDSDGRSGSRFWIELPAVEE